MSAEILATERLGASRAAMHIALMAAVIVIALVVYGVYRRWRRDSPREEDEA
ncbi:MAG: hypothetical protein ACXVY8_10485 [Gaiellaceae bacterium]